MQAVKKRSSSIYQLEHKMSRKESGEKPRRMKLRDAAAYLGTSAAKVSRLVKSGELKCVVDPLDRRRKIVKVEDLDRIKESSLAVGEGD